VAGICADGFAADPLMGWVFQDESARHGGLVLAFTGLTQGFFAPNSVVQVVGDACAALWRSPAYVAEPASGDDAGESPWPPDVAERFRILSELMEMAHPHDRPHWYLNVLATRPSSQGHGLGAIALRSVLERADAAGEPAYLESSNPRNMTLYRRHGFDDFADPIDMPDGPSLYPMWREPR
jgi:GNAT superfamily N-acetyltransferase